MESKKFILGANGLEPVKEVKLPMFCELILHGARMSESRGAIFEQSENGTQWAVTMTDYDTPRIFAVDDYIMPISKKFGIGKYYYDDMRTVERSEIMPYVTKAREAEIKRNQDATTAAKEAEIAKEIGKKLFSDNMPKGATHVIIASHRVNESDGMTDYYGHSTDKAIILAFSDHKRDIFAEMRKACLNCDIEGIRVYGETADENHEHREKYTGGGGYYLGEGRHSGWCISKTSIEYNTEGHYTNAGRENGFYAFKGLPAQQAEPTAAPVNVPTGKIQIVDYSERAIAVIGDTYEIREKLGKNGLGGKWNKFLTCGPGWIFPKSRLEEVKAVLMGTPTPPADKAEPAQEPAEDKQPEATYTMSATPKGKPILTLHSIPDGNYKGKGMELVFIGTWTDGKTDRIGLRYGKKVKFDTLSWHGSPTTKQVYLNGLYHGSYGDIKLQTTEFAEYLQAIGAVNELARFNEAVKAWNRQDEARETQAPDAAPVSCETTLREEIVKTVEFFKETDIKNTGEISAHTLRIAHIQKVDIDLFSAPQMLLTAPPCMNFHPESKKGGANA